MMKRNEREMVAMLAKFVEQLGSFDKWSEAAMVKLEAWVKDLDRRLMANGPQN